MNVRNLKQMFEQRGSIKTNIQSNQVPKTIPKPLVTNEMPTNKIVEEKIIAPEPKSATITTINKNFLQQLNKKLDNKNANLGSVRSGGLTFLQPPQTFSEPIKSQNQLNIEDIITGAANKNQAYGNSKARHAINESHPQGQQQKNIFEELGSAQFNNDTISFQELLGKAIQNMNLLPDEVQEGSQNHEPRKSRVVNKYEYAQDKLTREQKVKRIDFVLKVIFGDNQFQIIRSNKEKQHRNTAVFKTIQPKNEPIVAIQEPKKNNSQTLLPNSTPVMLSTESTIIPQIIKPANNPFLDELKKLQKKQTKIITASQQIICSPIETKPKQPDTMSFTEKISNECATPRQKKKQKKLQSFDNL